MKDVKSKKQICARRRKVFVISLILFSICMHMVISLNREYRYAGRKSRWQKSNLEYVEGVPVLGEYNQYLEDVLAQCKSAIDKTNELREQYSYLNWQNYEQVKIASCLKLYLSDEFQTSASDSIYAVYKPSENTVLVMELSVDRIDMYFLMRIIIHELMHCLTYNTGLSGGLYEGIAEILCKQVCEQNFINYTENELYKYDVWVVQMLENTFGRQKLIYMAYYNILNDVIDKYTHNFYGEKMFTVLNNLSYLLQNNTQRRIIFDIHRKTMLRIIQDVLVHLTVNYCKEDFCEGNRTEILMNCKDQLQVKEDYFKMLFGEEGTQ